MRKDRGGTLLAVLLALSLLTMLGAALAARALAHVEAGRALARGDVARAAADAALVATWRSWDGAARSLDTVGQATKRTLLGDSAVVEVQVLRTAPRLWWLSAAAWTSGASAGRAVSRASALALWLAVGGPMPRAAVSGAGDLSVASSALLAGDVDPPGWGCTPLPPLDAAELTITGHATVAPGAVRGAIGARTGTGPDVPAQWELESPVITSHADLVLPSDTVVTPVPVADTVTCQRVGWGEPDRLLSSTPCRRRFVVVHALGALTLRGGRAQGVLLVDGPLTLEAGVQVAGLVLARGGVRLREGSRISGAVVLRPSGTNGWPVAIADSSAILGSSCVVRAALAGGNLLAELPGQAWYWLW